MGWCQSTKSPSLPLPSLTVVVAGVEGEFGDLGWGFPTLHDPTLPSLTLPGLSGASYKTLYGTIHT